MTLDEEIKHYEEMAESAERSAKLCPRPDKDVKGSGRKYLKYLEYAKTHRRIAEWLKELKDYRDARVGYEYCKHKFREQHERPYSLCQRNFMDMFEREVNADED